MTAMQGHVAPNRRPNEFGVCSDLGKQSTKGRIDNTKSRLFIVEGIPN